MLAAQTVRCIDAIPRPASGRAARQADMALRSAALRGSPPGVLRGGGGYC